jgi:hypothetical protein
MRRCVTMNPPWAATRIESAREWGSVRDAATSMMRPQPRHVKWSCSLMLPSKRACGPGRSLISPSATKSLRFRYTVPRLTRGKRRRTRRCTASAVGCESAPSTTSSTTRRGLISRSPRSRRAASESGFPSRRPRVFLVFFLVMIVITGKNATPRLPACQAHSAGSVSPRGNDELPRSRVPNRADGRTRPDAASAAPGVVVGCRRHGRTAEQNGPVREGACCR